MIMKEIPKGVLNKDTRDIKGVWIYEKGKDKRYVKNSKFVEG